ncbi:hypothetical protein EG328_008571 [Venturia inaequalis]|uniref:Uncharacterized protein n=1 Tax=Venturia inaequalis TaxID=5025 RepID=A0A8H3VCE1_VENIN|nr:hypothetical protein EG328_008571 [Venturia inaequalis]
METPTEPARVASSRAKKRSWPKKKPKKPQDQQLNSPSMKRSNITVGITPAVNDKHSLNPPKLADKDTNGPPADVTPDRTTKKSTEEPPKVTSTKSKKNSTRMSKEASTAVNEIVKFRPRMLSRTAAPLSVKTCNSKQGNSLKEHVEEGAMINPEELLNSFSATVELVDLFSEPSFRKSQAAAPKLSQRLSFSSRKKKSTEPRGGVPFVRLPQIPSGGCYSPQAANVDDLNILNSNQDSSAGPPKNARVRAPSPKGKNKLDQNPSVLDAQALVLTSPQTAPMKPCSTRKLTVIDEDAESILGESSSSSSSVLPNPQRSTTRTKRKKGNENQSPQPAREVQTVEVPQTPSEAGAGTRAEIAKNLSQVFATYQRLVTQNRSQKTIGKRKKFPFLRLPRELRDMIIEYTIGYDGIDPIRKFDNKLQEWMTDLDEVFFRSTPTILLINQQIHEEAQEILRKKTLRISHPPQYPIKSIYDSSHVISDEALSRVSRIQFELNTYPATERRQDIMQPDWKGESMYKDEYLANSYPWAMLLNGCFQVWRGAQDPRYLEISIDHCSGERSQFKLAVFGEKMLAFENCIDAVLESHDLDALMDFFMFADAPVDFV